jgi:hypothetical protein
MTCRTGRRASLLILCDIEKLRHPLKKPLGPPHKNFTAYD